MLESDTIFSVFIDYDNLQHMQKIAGVLDVITKVLIQIPLEAVGVRARCDVRLYGGWYENTEITRRAQDLSVEIQRDFPKIIRLPVGDGSHVSVSATAELAVALLQEPSHHLFNTYRRKGKPYNVRVEQPNIVGCSDPDCILPMMKKLLKTGRCPKPGCDVLIGDLIYRHEQKIVDTMLSCDLIYAAGLGANLIILVSDDDDFIPPLRTVLLRGAAAARFHPKPNCQRASFPRGGATLFEKDL